MRLIWSVYKKRPGKPEYFALVLGVMFMPVLPANDPASTVYHLVMDDSAEFV